ncbi:hypothetical protein S40285_10357 [Stachybotrys chlorohalonatus IBT 40285]|uniref:Uncharacterized protein n=1 Tax=Stachybotrys chlorohalonatus (strain IBT 40285) TaxID=1283841 RepID=A0A084QBJ3_STAC4|nr:hypothetical protein S40285_10357 [Stachybotrys chlorohalonata IBT 40285]
MQAHCASLASRTVDGSSYFHFVAFARAHADVPGSAASLLCSRPKTQYVSWFEAQAKQHDDALPSPGSRELGTKRLCLMPSNSTEASTPKPPRNPVKRRWIWLAPKVQTSKPEPPQVAGSGLTYSHARQTRLTKAQGRPATAALASRVPGARPI